MRSRDKLSKLSRLELVELIYDIRRDNVSLQKRCKRLEEKLTQLREKAREESGNEQDEKFAFMSERLDHMEDLLRDIRRQVIGRRSVQHTDDGAGGSV